MTTAAPKKPRKPKVEKPTLEPYFILDPELHLLAEPDATLWVQDCDYAWVRTVQELREFIAPALANHTPIGTDWETDSLNVWKLKAVGISICIAPGVARYAPVGHSKHPELNVPWLELVELLKEIDAHNDTIWFNYDFDGAVNIREMKWEPTRWQDAEIGVFLENSGLRKYGLKFTAKRLLGLVMPTYKDTVGEVTNFSELHPEQAYAYACSDADVTLRLWLLKNVQKAVKAQEWIYGVEKRTSIVLREGIERGFYVSKARLIELRDEVAEYLSGDNGLLPQILAILGPINLNSPQQLGPRLVALGIPIEERTKTKKIATGKPVLLKYKDAHPVMQLLVDYSELDFARALIKKLLAAIAEFGPLLRFPIRHVGVPTGRMKAGGEGKAKLAYSKGVVDANIQAIPDRSKKDENKYYPDIRTAFVANPPRDEWPEGYEECDLIVTDYEQMELRIAANLSKEQVFIDAFLAHVDVHGLTAALGYGEKPGSIVKPDPRRQFGKTMNFAMLFKAGPATVAKGGGVSEEKATELIDNFFRQAPRLKAWIESVGDCAKSSKFIDTFFGRRRPLDEYFTPDAPRWMVEKGKREAISTLVQGTAADVFKLAIHRLRQFLLKANLHARVSQILWLHDELVVRCPKSLVEQVKPLIVEAFLVPVEGWPVPLDVGMKVSDHWF